MEIGQFDDENGFVRQEFDNEYDVGWFNSTPLEVKHKNIQYTAAYYLGIDFKEIRPRVDILDKERKIDGKYVCISTQSTAQCKYWNNPEGWSKTIKYLNELGYKVVCIDKQRRYGSPEGWSKGAYNDIPEEAIDKTGDFSLQERITDIYNCEFFIGLGSGLSWLAWGLGKNVVLISGFSNEETEFYTPYRVINKEVCNSCWNRESFDAGNWHWCPDHENTERQFECSKEITFEAVKEQIDKLI